MRAPLLILVIGLTGCVSPSHRDTGAHESNAQAQIRERIEAIFDAAEQKDMPRLDSYHLYGPAFTKFSGQSGRQDAVSARKSEHDGLGRLDGLVMRAQDLKIDVFGTAAIATFILDYSFKAGTATIRKRDRATLIFVNDSGSWKITHEHLSALAEPAATQVK